MSASSTDRWVKCISTQGNIRGVAIQATELIQSMADRHQLRGEAIRGLGESVMGALLIASYCKPGQRVNLNIRGSGHYQQALVDAYPEGKVRGYVVDRSQRHEPNKQLGPWGTGLLSVLRTRSEEKGRPYIGTVPLLTGHLAKDLSFYWVQSEQIPSAVGLAVNLEKGKVASAGGFLVQALPGASAAEVQTVEHHINEIQSLMTCLAQNPTPMNLLVQIFQSTAFIVVEEKPIEFQCTCSWERVQRALILVGSTTLKSMLDEDHEALIRCDFCTKEYRVDEPGLERLIESTSQMAKL